MSLPKLEWTASEGRLASIETAYTPEATFVITEKLSLAIHCNCETPKETKELAAYVARYLKEHAAFEEWYNEMTM